MAARSLFYLQIDVKLCRILNCSTYNVVCQSRNFNVLSSSISNKHRSFLQSFNKQRVCCFSDANKAPWMNTELKNPIDGVPKEEPLPEISPEEESKRRDDSWRKMKYSLLALGAMLGFGSGSLAYNLGKPKYDEEGNLLQDEFTGMPLIPQYFRRMIREVDFYSRMIKEPSRDKLLPDPATYPYVQPPYTLVLELTDLLVHPEWTYSTGWRFKKRPGVDKFLEQIGPPNFEVVVYTAEQGMTVFPILDSLDPNGYIMYRLVRDATDFIDGHHVKNLDCLNRDLKKVIVIDWNQNSIKLHRDNAFILPRWKGNDDDTTLMDLAAFLKTILVSEVEDVRDVLIYYKQFDNPIDAFKENQRKLLEQLEEQEKYSKMKKENPPLTSRWSNSFLRRS